MPTNKVIERDIKVDSNHDYRNIETGKKLGYISVTGLIDLIWPFPKDEIDPVLLEKGIQRGNCIHERINHFLETDEQLECTHQVKEHDNQFKWLVSQVKKLKEHPQIGKNLQSELSLASDDLQLCGTIDLCWPSNVGYTITDYKTTKYLNYEKEFAQCYLYSLLVKAKNNQLKVPYSLETWYIFNTNKKVVYDPKKVLPKEKQEQIIALIWEKLLQI